MLGISKICEVCNTLWRLGTLDTLWLPLNTLQKIILHILVIHIFLYQYRLLDPCFARRLEALDLKAQDLGEKAKAREIIARTRSFLIVLYEKSLFILLNSC